MARPISKTEYETLATFRYTLRRFQRFSETAARQAGITPKQHQALLAIAGFPGRDQVTVGELAERLQTRHHSTVGLVDRLTEQGLVERTPGVTDRREVFVSLTPKGSGILAGLSAVHRDELGRMGQELGLLLQQLAAQ